MSKQHQYTVTITWTGNRGTGTSDSTEYDRNHTLSITGKPDIACSSDTVFRGDGTRHNPEDMLVASAASCHMLWYLHLCADAGVVATAYTDSPTGTMVEKEGGGGHFTEIVLNPKVTVTDATMIDKANELHSEAHARCFIANSCNFPITHKPHCTVQ